mgnify:CR=1 FL=1|jgi:hypothetical protein
MSEPTSTASVSLRGILAALVSAVGLLLLIVAPGRSADWFAEGLGLAMLGVVLLAAGLALIVSTQRTLLYAVAILTTVVAAWLVITRTAGYPFGPWSSVTPQMGPYEVLVLVLSIISLTLAIATLVVGTEHLGTPGIRFDTLAPFAIVLVALPGLAVSKWADNAAHILGSGHTHSHTMSSSSDMPGMDHSMMSMMTIEERLQFGEQLVIAREAALKFPTLADARAAGWILVGGYVSGAGQMVMDPTGNSQDQVFDPAVPQGLLYSSSIDSATIVGLQYDVWTGDGSTPSGFIGQDMLWHMHTGTCEITESFAIPYDESVTGKACSNVNGTLTNTVSWMLRAWVVPGWENPQGTLTHDNSLLP